MVKEKSVLESSSEGEIKEKLDEFLRSYYYNELLKTSKEGGESLVIEFAILDRFDPILADRLSQEPDFVLEIFDKVVKEVDLPGEQKINVRIKSLPESSNIRIRNLRAKHLGKLLTVDCVVKAASEVKPQIYEAIFKCPDCDAKIIVVQDENILKQPLVCECGRRGRFDLIEKKMMDMRWLIVDEPFEITTGEQPGSISVFLKDDNTNPKMQKKTDPGNNLKITGIFRELPKRIKGKLGTKMDIYIDANHVESAETEFDEIEITPEDEKQIIALSKDEKIFEKLTESIATGIYGYTEIKQAMVLQLFGGMAHQLPDKSRLRGNIHILITGDPGVGKTRMMQTASKIIPRGKYVSGKGVTGAGLCTTYDSVVYKADGSIEMIGDLVERNMNNPIEIEPGIFVSKGKDDCIVAFDDNELKMKPMKITKYWKIKSPKTLLKITTQTGKQVTLTTDNPIPVLRNSKVIWIKANDITRNDFIVTPRSINVKNSKKKIDTLRFLDKTAHVSGCEKIVEKAIQKIQKKETLKSFIRRTGLSRQGMYWWWRKEKSAPKISDLIKICQETGIDLLSNLPSVMKLSQFKGHTIKLPKYLTEDMMYFFGLLAGDGNLYESSYNGISLRFSSIDKELNDKFRKISLGAFGIEPEYYKHPERIPYLRIHSKIIGKIANDLGLPIGKKTGKIRISKELSELPNNLLKTYIQGLFDTDGYVSIRKTRGSHTVGMTTSTKGFARDIQLILMKFGILARVRMRKASISFIKNKKVISDPKYEIEMTGIENIRTFKTKIGFGFSVKNKKLDKLLKSFEGKEPKTNIDMIPNIGELIRKARLDSELSAKKVYGYKGYAYEKSRRAPSRKMLSKLIRKFNEREESVIELKKFAKSDIFWDKIKKIEKIKGEKFVYDVTVEKEHSFIANGIVIHNTASVVKNEVIGGWILQAGALVLANKGVIAIDEFDKMNPDDQVAMHEAMSVSTISIAKASIVATLPADTAVLAGANPRLGRFDPYQSIPQQINIPETLLSRFDLKFALKDKPDKDADDRIAQHILDIRETPDVAEPAIDPVLLRKYIAFARKIEKIDMTKEAGQTLKNFYNDMRNEYSGEAGSTVAITLRQFEAMIRIAEASAKVRLDKKVTIQDAERAINLMKYSLVQLGTDIETGKIDIDRLESGISTSQRNRIKMMMDIIKNLQEQMGGKEVAVQDLKAEAEDQGIANVDETLERLKQEGMIFVPKAGYIRTV